MRSLSLSVGSVGLEDIFSKNNLLLAHAVDDILAVQRADVLQLTKHVADVLGFSGMMANLVTVNEAYDGLFRYEIEHNLSAGLGMEPPLFAERLMLPTATVSHYTHSVRRFVEAELETGERLQTTRLFDEYGDEALDSLLIALDPNFVEMRQGSWAAVRAGGPDCLRHAGVSQRELMTQLLCLLVPNAILPDENQQGPQIKARVRVEMRASTSEATYIDVMVKAIYEYYNQLNKYTHHNERHIEGLIATLHVGEALMRYLLCLRNQRLSDS